MLAETQCPGCGFFRWAEGFSTHDCEQFRADVETWRAVWSNMWPANDPPSNGAVNV